ncbi:arsenic resistance protein [Methylophaga sp.]|uniref:arsenic resistance protein n=1 Tax=Methylophaga sp. TaxID=2024840 RepID=UPI00271B8F72|nr:arsenic resistance protein [Methylophaga sp.]MDO8828142.1 arsenic resistance protein [Methylophaga sp.]
MLKLLNRLLFVNISMLLLAGISIGATTGYFSPSAGEWLGDRIDMTLLVLITLLFFGVRFEAIVRSFGHLRFISIAVFANFVLVPLIGYAIASVLMPDYPLIMVGLLIYFMSPCTDWFLGFTQLAKGNVALGTALIPINMLLQLLLYPLYLQLFTNNIVQVDPGIISSTLLQWFLLPLLLAICLHYLLRFLVKRDVFNHILQRVDQLTPWVIALLVLEIFASNITVILQNSTVFSWLLLGVFIFFVATFLLGEVISRLFRLSYPEHALLTMTIAARNAPLMLAVTMVALPGQPLIYAAIVIGMLLEFPHLTALRYMLLNSNSLTVPLLSKLRKKYDS